MIYGCYKGPRPRRQVVTWDPFLESDRERATEKHAATSRFGLEPIPMLFCVHSHASTWFSPTARSKERIDVIWLHKEEANASGINASGPQS